MRMHVLMHIGTGAQVVKRVLTGLGAKVTQVHSRDAVFKAGSFDALILLGGADIDPFWYGQKDKYCQGVNRSRDAIEWTMLRRAMFANLPILGICRGMQFLAVAQGAALVQDINKQNLTRKNHTTGMHQLIEVHPKLADHMPEYYVNSYHHQALLAAPTGFKVMAKAADGVIEAIWKPGALGVQFHPELMIDGNEQWAWLFRWLLEGLR